MSIIVSFSSFISKPGWWPNTLCTHWLFKPSYLSPLPILHLHASSGKLEGIQRVNSRSTPHFVGEETEAQKNWDSQARKLPTWELVFSGASSLASHRYLKNLVLAPSLIILTHTEYTDRYERWRSLSFTGLCRKSRWLSKNGLLPLCSLTLACLRGFKVILMSFQRQLREHPWR